MVFNSWNYKGYNNLLDEVQVGESTNFETIIPSLILKYWNLKSEICSKKKPTKLKIETNNTQIKLMPKMKLSVQEEIISKELDNVGFASKQQE